MRILVVGSGGREHALAWKLSQEATVFVAPGNPGIATCAELVPIQTNQHAEIAEWAKANAIDLVVVGPEDPLIEGLGDLLRNEGLATFGPSKEGAQLEGSKAFSKALMKEADITTASFETFTDANFAKEFARHRFHQGYAVVVKASGNALGKGVVVADTVAQAEQAIDDMMVKKVFGEAGEVIVVEDRLRGREFSLLTIVGDHNFVSLPVAQDHKRVGDGDEGPNTGGMGTFSPVSWVSPALVQRVESEVVAPALAVMKRRGIPYRGILFSGIMLHLGEPHCLEFNVRFGDPEAQTVMRRVGSGLAQALYQAATGEMITPPDILDNAAISVVLASAGYPGAYEKGQSIQIGDLPDSVEVFHAGTKLQDGVLVSNGGRVLAVSSARTTIAEARQEVYESLQKVSFEGAIFRRDIAI